MSVPSVSRQFGRITRLDKELGRSASWAVAAGGRRDGGEWREQMKLRERNLAFIAPPARYSVKFWRWRGGEEVAWPPHGIVCQGELSDYSHS